MAGEILNSVVMERALDVLMNVISSPAKGLSQKSAVLFGSAFRRYLDSMRESCNAVRSPATGPYIHVILGNNSIYENPNLRYQQFEIETYTAESVFNVIDDIRRKSEPEL